MHKKGKTKDLILKYVMIIDPVSTGAITKCSLFSHYLIYSKKYSYFVEINILHKGNSWNSNDDGMNLLSVLKRGVNHGNIIF